MVSVWLLVLAFMLGAFFGAIIMGLCCSNRDDK